MTSTAESMPDTGRTQATRSVLTDRLVKDAPAPANGNRITYDARLPGFGLRVTAAGARSFVFNYSAAGRERRITIGRYPAWSVLAARKQAEQLRRQVDLGGDPLETRIEERAAPTVRDLFDRYASDHLPNKTPRSAQDDRAMWRNDILPRLGSRKVRELVASDCDELHKSISLDRPVRANRVIEVLRKALNLAIRWGWIERNPAAGVRRNQEQKRHRYLRREDVARLISALELHSERASADAILLMLLTGCRKSEALQAQWKHFDMQTKVWTKPSSQTKQRREHRSPYSLAVADLLSRRAKARTCGYVFAGERNQPLQDVRRTWAAVCRASGLSRVRLHDLRHTFASLAASSGQSLLVVGELLGHSTHQTTKRYASLYDDTLRVAAEGVAAVIGLSAIGRSCQRRAGLAPHSGI